MTLQILRRKHPKLARAAVARAVVFLYALFLLMPHFGSVTHVHVNGGAAHGHIHATASRHDVALERAALAFVPGGVPHLEINAATQDAPRDAQDSESSKGSTNSDHPNDANLSDHTTLSDRDARAHTHGANDPNLVGLGAPAFAAAEPIVHALAPDAIPGLVPALALLAASARAPPAHV